MKLDMTKGNILPLIITFAVPLFFSNLFQQFYNIADTAIVGHTLGDHALSAVGAVSSIYGLVTSLCFGMSNGFSILISFFPKNAVTTGKQHKIHVTGSQKHTAV